MNQAAKRIVCLLSGTGIALQGLLDAMYWGTVHARVVAVFSHEAWGYGLMRAEREGVPALLHDLAAFRAAGKSDQAFNDSLAERIAAYEPDLVVIAGWQLPLGERFLTRFPHKVLNLQQGFPGQYPLFDPYGRNPVSRDLEAFKEGRIRGTLVTLQTLRSETGAGEIVAQAPVPIYEFDTLIDLEERVTRTQQELLVNTLHLLLRDTGLESD